jgi:hypothetical protein
MPRQGGLGRRKRCTTAAELGRTVAAVSAAERQPAMDWARALPPAIPVCPATAAALAVVAPSAISPGAARRLPLIGAVDEAEQVIALLEGATEDRSLGRRSSTGMQI